MPRYRGGPPHQVSEGQGDFDPAASLHGRRRREHLQSRVTRNGEDGSDTHGDIIRAARDLFLQRGYNGVSMREVSRAVNVTPAALYYHFPDGKEDLFVSVMMAAISETAENIRQVAADSHSIREKLVKMARYWFESRDTGMSALMDDVAQNLPDMQRHRIFEFYGKTFNHTSNEVFQASVESGDLRSDIPVGALSSAFQGMVIAFLRSPEYNNVTYDPELAAKAADIVATLFLEGAASNPI